ncbi:hypothetical protein AD998_14490 [bacterium 336/3]|nr:hypothetical protein AD998_14490 [bacterium 336/3]
MKIVVESQYFPPLAYFCLFLSSENLTIDIFEYYQKQSYRNRFQIVTSQGTQSFSVPVVKGNQKKALKEIKIDYHESWVNVHWRSIFSAYGKSPFFEYYANFFEKILYKKPIFLVDLNMEILTTCLKLIGIKKNFEITEKYLNLEKNSEYTDFRSAIHPKNKSQIDSIYKPMAYQQVFGSKFEDNMSIIDLLFCEGNNAYNILKASIPNKLSHEIVT